MKGKQYQAGILLGGVSSYGKDSVSYFGDASDRFIQANKLYSSGIIKKIIVSGGRIDDNQPKEAGFLKQQLIESGVPKADVITEDQSKNTFENAVFTNAKLNHVKFNYGSFKDSKLADLNIAEENFTSSDFTNADMCNTIIMKSSFVSCTFENGILMYLNCENSASVLPSVIVLQYNRKLYVWISLSSSLINC